MTTNNIIVRISLTVVTLLTAAAGAAASTPFVSHGSPARFLDIDLHATVGMSTVTQNYVSCFPQITELDLTPGTSVGLGAGARLWFTDFIGLGCEANVAVNNYKAGLAVADDDALSMTNVFIRNRYYTANFPVFVTLGFNIGDKVRWNVDAGMYYTYGLSGRSKSTLYSARINELGQLITSVTHDKVSYYNSPETFITSFYRGDLGVHLATSLTFVRRYYIGVRTDIGVKNAAHAYNAITTPNVHNVSLMFALGYHF